MSCSPPRQGEREVPLVAVPVSLLTISSMPARIVLIALFCRTRVDEVLAYQRGGPAPFVVASRAALANATSLARSSVIGATRALVESGHIRSATRVVEGKQVAGWELTPVRQTDPVAQPDPPRAKVDVGRDAYRTRRELYAAAGLPLGDKVSPPDERFATACKRLGRHHHRVVAAVAARNALAATGEKVAIAIARDYSASLPVMQRNEAEQEARIASIRAAELWTPKGGAAFTTYARTWINKYVGKLADRSHAVTLPERERLKGARIQQVEFDGDLHLRD